MTSPRALSQPALVGATGGAVAFLWFTLLALARWNDARATSYDLGIFGQAAEQWSRGNLPRSFIRGDHTLLADHFSPITALFGVAWKVWPDPRALLVTQALCLAVGVGVMAGMAAARLGLRPAALVVLTGCLGKWLIAGDLFDVHEVAFAVPLMAVLCWAFLERRFGWAVAASVLLVLVKEDLGLTVGMAGLVWWWRTREPGRRRISWDADTRKALLLCVIGTLGLVLAVVTIAHFNPSGRSSYLDYFTGGGASGLAEHSEPPVHELALTERLAPLVMLTATTVILGWRSSLIWLAAPTLAWRMLSSNASYWSSDNHYDLILWPIAIAAAIEAWQRWPQPSHAKSPGLVRMTDRYPGQVNKSGTLRGLIAGAAALAVLLNASQGIQLLADRSINPVSAFSRSAELDDLDRVTERVPAGERIAAQNHLGPYLITRYRVTMLGVDRPEKVRYAVLVDDSRREFQAQPCERAAYIDSLSTRSSVEMWREGHVVLVRFGVLQPAGMRRC